MPSRKKERVFLLFTTAILALLFVRLYIVLQQNFTDVDRRLNDGTMVNLNAPNQARNLARLLRTGYYFEDKKDIDLIEHTVAKQEKAGNEFDNIGEINKSKFNVDADEAFAAGGKTFKERVLVSRTLLGYTGDDSIRFEQERKNPPELPSVNDLGMNGYSISGTVKNKITPVSRVLVRLQMVVPQDSIFNDEETDEVKTRVQEGKGYHVEYVDDGKGAGHLQNITAYARTGSNGEFNFKNLPAGRAFNVLPLQPGFQFGRSAGTENLDEDQHFTFQQSPHTIRLLSTRDFSILKKEKALIIRTPDYFNRWYWIIAGCFFASFLIIHIVLSVRYPEADQIVLPLVMLLTGISFVTLLNLQDPLRDRFFAKDSLMYLGMGIAAMLILLLISLRRFTPDSRLYRMLVFKNSPKAANGWPWIIVAMGLLMLTIKFGSGPEGSGVKVNLFGFQPSEIVKYLIILFLAGFFAVNERFISEYASWRKRLSFFSFALIAIAVTLLLFLMLGDMGPAIVICFTFIILFSFSRGDFMFMALSVVFYVLMTWIFKNVWISTAATAVVLIFNFFYKRRTLSESAIMALVIISGFLTIDKIPYLDKLVPGPVQRLVDRKAIWQDAWNNEVYGGDQVANGLWAMSGGGITGQGVGEGFAKTIPEAHTDMILPAIGESFGWTGIVSIFLLFLLYLHRSIIIGRQTGTPFLFYLCSGIGICTFIQFLLIAGGSTGALPLSGVALPFESYGGSSLVANLLAAGFLLSASKVKGTEVQMKFITRQQDKNLVPALLAAVIGIALLIVNISSYLFDSSKWIVKPALVADRSGARMFSYNPRIAILMNKLQAGTLYDRNGLILATSNPQLIKQQKKLLDSAGVGSFDLDSAMHKRLTRYYPFQEQMFFWTGDNNTGIFNGSTNGYFAEYEHAAELRGFKMPTASFNAHASRFREDRFLPRGVKEMSVSKRDYSALAPLLLSGLNSAAVDSFKKRNRDLQMTVDASLQTHIQQALAADTAMQDNRVSVVVMLPQTGDVLASAVYPLPPVNNYDQLTMPIDEQNQLSQWMTTSDLGFTYATQPGSTAKVLTAMASFNKLGLAAKDVKFHVSMEERIRTKGIEPDETGIITLERAIAKSNNVYFIKLANEKHLQEDMVTLYMKAGMFLHGVGGYFYNKRPENLQQEEKWRELWRRTEFNTKPRYDPNNIHKTRAKGISGMAWGQGELIATPAAIARLVSGVANNGDLVANRFVLKVADTAQPVKPSIKLANDPQYAALLTQYMIEQSAPKEEILHLRVAGKTGTPERIWKGNSINDGWYTFFAPMAKSKGNIVVCIRIESTRGSSDAVHLAGRTIIPLLLKSGYIKNITPDRKKVQDSGAEQQTDDQIQTETAGQ
ncbi:FtsW/RodA/SpoVE family cell cycle protein [Mucilaginibacter sp. L3T2-6]|uniref:FtsW/RodA/SpoVE family cell cycle protein n=1 Tax=Mucilaginibacter sp. L3T2-6 TaxID=3062491 RepID=UPI0026759566|nr:FtsW/RodA/SpoVE family cell cycle protein [Mucilaginibacter sp. L3T2-6]MDO3645008.1 FtsW/RodA/SpoVE family cell cycle protein [Mucilaginibacter sp. L3T2-6]MDV6217459.1 FtsW/RodA/SpoVE family cell cycle protein [Mucilaginibacter sp. L3T2-6]